MYLDDERRARLRSIRELEVEAASVLARTPHVLLLSFPGINVVSAAEFARLPAEHHLAGPRANRRRHSPGSARTGAVTRRVVALGLMTRRLTSPVRQSPRRVDPSTILARLRSASARSEPAPTVTESGKNARRTSESGKNARATPESGKTARPTS